MLFKVVLLPMPFATRAGANDLALLDVHGDVLQGMARAVKRIQVFLSQEASTKPPCRPDRPDFNAFVGFDDVPALSVARIWPWCSTVMRSAQREHPRPCRAPTMTMLLPSVSFKISCHGRVGPPPWDMPAVGSSNMSRSRVGADGHAQLQAALLAVGQVCWSARDARRTG